MWKKRPRREGGRGGGRGGRRRGGSSRPAREGGGARHGRGRTKKGWREGGGGGGRGGRGGTARAPSVRSSRLRPSGLSGLPLIANPSLHRILGIGKSVNRTKEWADRVGAMNRWVVIVGLLAALLVSPIIAGSASAADVSVTLVAFN